MSRAQLPDRRPSQTFGVTWETETGSFTFDITVGFDPKTTQVLEVFYSDGMKTGTQLQASVQDTCIIISLALQHGASISALRKSLGEVQVMGQPRPASVIGAIMGALCERFGDDG